jgi:hypothetical protein
MPSSLKAIDGRFQIVQEKRLTQAISQMAAAHPAASKRGMRGAAAWKRYYIDPIYS